VTPGGRSAPFRPPASPRSADSTSPNSDRRSGRVRLRRPNSGDCQANLTDGAGVPNAFRSDLGAISFHWNSVVQCASITAVLWLVGLFRRFDNRRQIAAYASLAATPWQSGSINREQGVSKAGSPRLRTTLIQLAWLWLRHQPQSALAANGARSQGRMSAVKHVGILAPRKIVAIIEKQSLYFGQESLNVRKSPSPTKLSRL
jgi:hypothetical protein